MSLKITENKKKYDSSGFLIKDNMIFFRELFLFPSKKMFIHVHETGDLKARILKIIVTWSVMELKNCES